MTVKVQGNEAWICVSAKIIEISTKHINKDYFDENIYCTVVHKGLKKNHKGHKQAEKEYAWATLKRPGEVELLPQTVMQVKLSLK